MTRLTDEELADLLGCANDKHVGLNRHEVLRAVIELRDRRAQDLTAEEREALRWAQREMRSYHEPNHTSDHASYLLALAALDKVLRKP